MGLTKQESQTSSDNLTIMDSTYEIDCSQYSSSINLILHIDVETTTVSIINAGSLTKLNLITVIDLIGAVVTFGAGFKMSSNNDAALSAVGDMNTYQFMGEDFLGVYQIGTVGKILD